MALPKEYGIASGWPKGPGQVPYIGTRPYSGSFPNYYAALTKTKAGQARTIIRAIGDSTTMGAFGGTPVATFGNNGRGGSYPTQLQNLFVSSSGLPSGGKNIFGFNNVSGTTYVDYNNEASVGTGWISGGTGVSLGAQMWRQSSANQNLLGFIDATLDTIEVTYPINTGLGSVLRVMCNGAQIGALNNLGANGIAKATFSGTAGALGIGLDQGGAATGNAWAVGFAAWSAANKGVAVYNMGWSGSTTTNWIAAVNAYDPLPALAATTADLHIINLGINDWGSSVAQATFQSQLQTIATNAKALGGDLMMIGPVRSDPSLGVTLATQNQYVARIQTVATALGAYFFDIASIPSFANYTVANAAGLMGDGKHPNAAGYLVIAQALYAILGNP